MEDLPIRKLLKDLLIRKLFNLPRAPVLICFDWILRSSNEASRTEMGLGWSWFSLEFSEVPVFAKDGTACINVA